MQRDTDKKNRKLEAAAKLAQDELSLALDETSNCNDLNISGLEGIHAKVNSSFLKFREAYFDLAAHGLQVDQYEIVVDELTTTTKKELIELSQKIQFKQATQEICFQKEKDAIIESRKILVEKTVREIE